MRISNKVLIVMLLLFVLGILPQVSFATENESSTPTSTDSMEYSMNNNLAEDSSDYEDIYFDASSTSDIEDGSRNNPYREFNAERIKDNSVIHISDGVYNYSGDIKTVNNVTILGKSIKDTTVCNASLLNKATLSIFNITLKNSFIINEANLSVEKVTFEDSVNPFILSTSGIANVDSCSFINSSSNFEGSLTIRNSMLNMNNSLLNDSSARISGGIFGKDSELNIYNSVLNGNRGALFGGSVCSISSQTAMSNVTLKNNKASYTGGALYSLYGSLDVTNCVFDNNSAVESGAVFIDEASPCIFINNTFLNNNATRYRDVYLIQNTTSSVLSSNTFKNMSTNVVDNVAESKTPNLFIGDGNYTLLKSSEPFNGTIPDSYDLRQLGLVTGVKNQGSGGNCWAFASIGSLESAILRITNTTYDFSEENMKNIMAFYSDYGWNISTNNGGNSLMSIGYLTSWLGPVDESKNEYRPDSILSPVFSGNFHVQNVVYLNRNDYLDNDEIKKAVMNYGGVTASLGWYGSFGRGSAYYCNDATLRDNHQVVIIGWNDSFSRNSFRYTPPGDGAWIVKNSWGTNYGESSYYYVSYYDALLALNEFSYTFMFNDTVRYDKNYQYDIPGCTDFFFNRSEYVWYKNRFTATDNEYLQAVSTYFRDSTDYEISVFVNDELKLVQNASTGQGYYTISLLEKIALSVGDVFEVIFKIHQLNETGVPISEKISLNKLLYRENISYVSYDGKTWTDLFNLTGSYENTHVYYSQVACIKAFTEKMNVKMKIDVKTENPSVITATLTDQYDNPVKKGKITYKVNDEEIIIKINGNKASLSKVFPIGTHNITLIFNDEGYNSLTENIQVCISNPADITMDLSVAQEDNLILSSFIVDDNGGLENGRVIFRVNGKTLRDDEGNVIYIDVAQGFAGLSYGIYNSWPGRNINVTAIYIESSKSAYITNSTIYSVVKPEPHLAVSFDKNIKQKSNATFRVKVTLDNSEVTTGRVVFKINKKTLRDDSKKAIYVDLDSDGTALLNYNIGNLKAKEHTLTVVLTDSRYKRTEIIVKFNVVKSGYTTTYP